jgi:2-dehydro-3-deoxyphosphogalactonate aldolase
MSEAATGAPWPKFKRALVAILRGVKPNKIDGIADLLAETGLEAIEIPLNSPDPFRSINQTAKRLGERCLIGAGTVLNPADVDRLADAGGRLLVSPNVDTSVLAQAHSHGMVTMPGVFSPTEALTAVHAGASALKFFPASVLGPGGVSAIRAVLPPDTTVGVVGGVSEKSFEAYAAVGVRTFGLGSSLYKPGDSAGAIKAKAEAAVRAYDAAFS